MDKAVTWVLVGFVFFRGMSLKSIPPSKDDLLVLGCIGILVFLSKRGKELWP